tara:strand:+ start:262 stop:528 length:267 start_codon:yes stop_codon:yes gene_type:complete
MSKKTEIKVYLPTRLVGELESRKRSGVRSKFIAEAIREKIDRRIQASPFDFSLHHLLATCREKLHQENKYVAAKIIQVILDEVAGYVD